jgi:hypothetical protein
VIRLSLSFLAEVTQATRSLELSDVAITMRIYNIDEKKPISSSEEVEALP